MQGDVKNKKMTEEHTIEEKHTFKKQRVGIVTSNKMDKTITVAVRRRIQHPIYGKFVKKTKKFLAHDEKNECNEGDTVKILSLIHI